MSTNAPATTDEGQDSRRDCLILVVDDRADNREAIAEAMERQGYAVLAASGGREAIAKIAAHAPDLVITDLKMPDMDGLELLKTARAATSPPEVILLTAYGTVETAVDALKHGAFNYLTKPVNLKDLRAQVEKALEHRRMQRDMKRLRRQVEVSSGAGAVASPGGEQFLFYSKPMRDLMAMVERLADHPSNVLIEGESGTGKEVIAQALHRAIPGAAERPFVAVHCAALPESLIEAELFGHERGAFTGAERQLIGRLELADGGTLFLDEVGEIPLGIQVKLLRALEQRELTRVGGRHVIKVNFRLVTATNRNLEAEVAAGRFREDLFYRLNVVRLWAPPLRERREDILPLIRHFLARFAAEQGAAPARLSGPVEQRLLDYAWPGNVRELRNLAERASIFAAGREISSEDLPSNVAAVPALGGPRGAISSTGRPMAATAPAGEGASDAATLDLQELERQAILRALECFGGNRSAAADALGISRRTLQRKLKEYRIADHDADA
jgi:DNA-binding NtrC family response regulator